MPLKKIFSKKKKIILASYDRVHKFKHVMEKILKFYFIEIRYYELDR